ncbi:hypothetical protein [Rhizobium leguminosarum]|uniref:hypothetical protein n=1 Tax=Rhizobium leguminosarum TaxID=384 RepID=UPI001440FA40|nr:hypothetical protein [Rhizobium leguminosarum]
MAGDWRSGSRRSPPCLRTCRLDIATDALVAWMACEGLVLLELLGLHRFDQTTKDAFFSRLKAIAAADNGEAS